MSEVVAKRYADALFNLANEQGNVDKIISELAVVKEVFNNDKNLNSFLNHPRVQKNEKLALVDTVFGKFDKSVVNTIKVLIERHRTNIMANIVEYFTQQYTDANRIVLANVYSVRLLTDDEKNNLAENFKQKLNKERVEINNLIDESLVGGVRIRIGNTIYDGSIANKLNRLKQNIVSASI